MKLLENDLYIEDLKNFKSAVRDIEKLKGKNLLISGATGMVGSFIVDAIMLLNESESFGCHIIALGRNEEKARERFGKYFDSEFFSFYACDVGKGVDLPIDKAEYIIHAASTTHPKAYATEPIGTLMVNIFGLNNLLDFAVKHNNERFAFVSSVEIYGENRGDTDAFDENYLGYINCNTLRAGYPEGKRAGEALCQAYITEKNLDIVIPRLARTYGPTMLMSDTKALSQFIKKGIAKEDIVLKSDGTQTFSYTYVVDAASGLMATLLSGKCGEAYNIADKKSNVMLKELASEIANFAGTKVVFEIPDATEAAGYSTATRAIMDEGKAEKELSWKASYDIKTGIERTLSILTKESK